MRDKILGAISLMMVWVIALVLDIRLAEFWPKSIENPPYILSTILMMASLFAVGVFLLSRGPDE